jgi:hypothetical protein
MLGVPIAQEHRVAHRSAHKLYKVTFLSHGKVYELYARKVQSSELYGFVQVQDLSFGGSADSMLVDPAEEKLREEFGKTRSLHLPMHSVVRIEEVEERGTVAIRDAESGEKVMPFPGVPPQRRS